MVTDGEMGDKNDRTTGESGSHLFFFEQRVILLYANIRDMPSFESRMSPRQEIPPKQEAKELVIRRSELRNAKNELICTMEEGREGSLLKKLVLHGTKNGVPTSVDVFALTGAGKDPDLKILTDGSRASAGVYDQFRNIVTAPTLSNTLSLGVLLHELGHYSQHQEEAFQEMRKASLFHPGDEEKIFLYLEKLQEYVPAIKTASFMESFNDLKRLREEWQQAKTKREQFEETYVDPVELARLDEQKKRISSSIPAASQDLVSYINDVYHRPIISDEEKREMIALRMRKQDVVLGDAFSSTLTAIFAEMDTLNKKYEERLRQPTAELEKIMEQENELRKKVGDRLYESYDRLHNLSKLIGERDATHRMLQWMREIKRHAGIDLFQMVRVPVERTALPTLHEQEETAEAMGSAKTSAWELGELSSLFCESYQSIEDKDIILTPQADLKAALATYRALGKQLRIHASDSDRVGKIPRMVAKKGKSDKRPRNVFNDDRIEQA